MSRKTKTHTRRQLHRAARRRALEQKQVSADATFMYKHTAEMRKMLKGVDLDRFEALAGS